MIYSTLLTRIKHPIYAGGMRYSNRIKDLNTGVRKLNPTPQITWGIIEPIISKEEWEQIQKIVLSNKVKFVSKEGKKNYLYSSLLKCVCGAPLRDNKVKKNIYHYRCSHCYKSINVNKVDELVYGSLFKHKKLKILDTVEIETIDFLEEIDNLAIGIITLENKKNEFLELFSENFLTKEKLKQKLSEIDKLISINNKELTGLNERIFKLKNNDSKYANLESLKLILKNVDEENFREIKEILNLIINDIKITSYKPLEIDIII